MIYNIYSSSVFINFKSDKTSSNYIKITKNGNTKIRNYYAVVYTNPKPKFIHTLVVRSGKFLRRLNLICGIKENGVSVHINHSNCRTEQSRCYLAAKFRQGTSPCPIILNCAFRNNFSNQP